jgi:hypothetical protein
MNFIFKYLSLSIIIAFALSSCSVTNHTYRNVDVNNKNIIHDGIIVDINVDVNKSIKNSSSKRNTVDEATSEAYFKAITENNIDIVVDPIFEITTTDKFLFFGGKSIAKLSGLAGYYSNPRKIKDVAQEMKAIKYADIENFKEFYFPNSSIKKNKSTSVKDESKIKLPLLSNSKLLSIGPSKFTKTNSNASIEVKKYAVSVYANTNKFFENDYGGEFENNGYSIGVIYDFNPTNKWSFRYDGTYSFNEEYNSLMKSLQFRIRLFRNFSMLGGASALYFTNLKDDSEFIKELNFGFGGGLSYQLGKNLILESKGSFFPNVGQDSFEFSYESIQIGLGYRF